MARLGFRRARGKAGEWYYCLRHQRVEEGPDCPAKNRMGPYPTRADAEHAMETAAERNQEWDTDPRWHEPQDGDAREE
jgi:hypothetical protein